MKIKIISIHDIGTNFGSTLQACALYDYVKSLGYQDVKVINYKPKYAYHHGKLGQLVKRILFFKEVHLQNKRFKEYYTTHCNLTRVYESYTQLYSEKDGDVFIVGSDQVWNEYYDAGRDPAYYLDFTECSNKMSYAASVGQVQTTEAMKRLVQNISNFKFISVREQRSVTQLHDEGIDQAVHVLDPIFLHNKDYYIDPQYVNQYGKYVLVYVVHSDAFMDSVVRKIAGVLDLKIVLVGGFIQKMSHDFYLRDIGPKEFVNLIYNAEFIVANSFHATAFSILFNKQFVLVKPKASPLRLSDMLQTVGINNRIISEEIDVDSALIPIDYTPINLELNKLQEKSKQYLANCLQYFLNEEKNG